MLTLLWQLGKVMDVGKQKLGMPQEGPSKLTAGKLLHEASVCMPCLRGDARAIACVIVRACARVL